MIRIDFSSCVAPRSPAKGSPAQRAGVYYERAVTDFFARQFLVAPQPTLLPSKKRPDLLVFDPGCFDCVIVEIKRQYIESSQSQVAEYARLVGEALPFLRIRTLVVCGELLRLEPNLRVVGITELFSLQENDLSVLVLSKRELKRASFAGELRLGLNGSGVLHRQPSADSVRKSGSPRYVVDVLRGLHGVVA